MMICPGKIELQDERLNHNRFGIRPEEKEWMVQGNRYCNLRVLGFIYL